MTATIHKFPTEAIKRIAPRPSYTFDHMPCQALAVRNGSILIRYLLGTHVKEKWVDADQVTLYESVYAGLPCDTEERA